MMRVGYITGDRPAASWIYTLNGDLYGLNIVDVWYDAVAALAQPPRSDIDVWLVDHDAIAGHWDVFDRHRERDGRLVPVIVVCASEEHVARTLRRRVNAVLTEPVGAWDVLCAVSAAASGELFISPRMLRQYSQEIIHLLSPSNQRPEEELTERETEVLRLLAEGMSNSRIAAYLHISSATVGTHVLSIRRKLQAANRTEAVVQAYRMGLVTNRSVLEPSAI